MSVRKEIKFAFLLGIMSILAIELVFKNIPSPSETFYKIGDIYLKFCYSLAASSIFYFINQHLPKEEKKEKSIKFIISKLTFVRQELNQVLLNLDLPKTDIKSFNFDEKDVRNAWAKIDPTKQVYDYMDSSAPFNNWFEYLNYKESKIKSLLEDLATANDSLNSSLYESILAVKLLVFPFVLGISDLPNWNRERYLYTFIYNQYAAILKACALAEKM